MDARIARKSVFTATIDLDAPGKHFGHIQIPYSRNDAALGNVLIPIISIRNGEGPCLLLNAGTHGDEFEGQIALRRLAHDIAPEALSGQVIITPSLNLPATLSNTRCSPIDRLNMNRIFPGNPAGSVSEKIASYFYQELVQRADVVIDLHAGGTHYGCLCYPMMHRYANAVTSRETFALLKAFHAPVGVVFDTEPDRDGMLDTAVEDLDKPFIAVELGSSGTVTPQSVATTMRGIGNLLAHCGVTTGETPLDASPTQIVGVPAGGFVTAEDHGIFEPFVDLGDSVAAGQAIGRLHSVHRPDREPLVHRVSQGGRVLIRRTTGTTSHGDCVLVVATPLDPDF
jgi:N-alpha-acetyl-L-2,4-diaminobutyrate deacetylase